MSKHVFSIEIDAPDKQIALSMLCDEWDGGINCFKHTEWPELPEAPDVHPYQWAEEAADIIDANIFTGDGGGAEGVAYMKAMCERWLRGLQSLAEIHTEVIEDATD